MAYFSSSCATLVRGKIALSGADLARALGVQKRVLPAKLKKLGARGAMDAILRQRKNEAVIKRAANLRVRMLLRREDARLSALDIAEEGDYPYEAHIGEDGESLRMWIEFDVLGRFMPSAYR